MYQSMKELRAAPGRAALITLTVGMIAVMVSFLSALAAGLSNQSISGIDEALSKNDAVVVDAGANALTSSSLTEDLVKDTEHWADQHGVQAKELNVARARLGEEPVIVLQDNSLSGNAVHIGEAGLKNKPETSTVALDGMLGAVNVKIAEDLGEVWLDHQPVVFAGSDVMAQLMPPKSQASAMVLVDGADAVTEAQKAAGNDGQVIANAKVLTGSGRYDLSSSYGGEQTSLNAMTIMLYVISALVVGAFFTVWTMQRMRGVAISSALGASRRVLLADSLAQAAAVLFIGIGAGVALTSIAGLLLAKVMPMVVDASTTVVPALILAATGLIGAVLALIPVFRVDPTTALANA